MTRRAGSPRGWQAMRAMCLLAWLALTGACSRSPAPSSELRVVLESAGPDTRLTLHAETGLKINARVAPALELADGTVLRFDARERTPDSAYFAAPPIALLTGRHDELHGRLRASVCRTDELVCRSLSIEL